MRIIHLREIHVTYINTVHSSNYRIRSSHSSRNQIIWSTCNTMKAALIKWSQSRWDVAAQQRNDDPTWMMLSVLYYATYICNKQTLILSTITQRAVFVAWCWCCGGYWCFGAVCWPFAYVLYSILRMYGCAVGRAPPVMVRLCYCVYTYVFSCSESDTKSLRRCCVRTVQCAKSPDAVFLFDDTTLTPRMPHIHAQHSPKVHRHRTGDTFCNLYVEYVCSSCLYM